MIKITNEFESLPIDFVDLGSTYTIVCACSWWGSATHHNGNSKRNLILYVKLLLLQIKVGLFLVWAFYILWKLKEESFSKCVLSLFCLGLGESIVGSFKCVLIMCSTETTKRQWYAHESKLKEIWSPRCALKIEDIANNSSSKCHSIWINDYHKLG